MTARYLDPPFTDQALVTFITSDIYLPPSEELTRSDIATGLSKLLAEERALYKTLFYLSCVALIGFLGVLATTKAHASGAGRSASSTSTFKKESEEAEQGVTPQSATRSEFDFSV